MNNKKHIWQSPWSYAESFVIAFALLCGSVLIELMLGTKAPTLTFPFNAIGLLLCVNTSVLLHLFSKKYYVFRWFSGIPASVGALGLFLLLSLTMALIPQQTNGQNFYFIFNVTSSWAYFIATAYLLVVLGMVTIKRLSPFSFKNIGFFFNHFGLWLTIAAATMGSGDIEKHNMELIEGKTTWLAYNQNNNHYKEMNFALKLHSFIMEEYPAKLALFDIKTGDILNYYGKKAIYETDSSKAILFRNYTISVEKHLPTSMFSNGAYFPISDTGATQSYLVEIRNNTNNETKKAWVGSANISHQSTFFKINDSVVLSVLKPEAKRYASKITVYEPTGKTTDTIIEVNKPLTIANHKLYQTGYDESKGRWSKTSILEIVKDPWLPLVYIGIYMMIAGALYLIWFGRSKRNENVE